MYVLLIMQKTKDGQVISAAHNYKTSNEALDAYYTELAAFGASGLAEDTAVIMSPDGVSLRVDNRKREEAYIR